MADSKQYVKTEKELKALVNTADGKDISMKFWISKCTKVIAHRGKLEPAGVATSTGSNTNEETDKGFKYIRVFETNENM